MSGADARSASAYPARLIGSAGWGDERRVVDIPVLIRMACGREIERWLDDRHTRELPGGARRSHDRAAEKLSAADALGLFGDHPHELVARAV